MCGVNYFTAWLQWLFIYIRHWISRAHRIRINGFLVSDLTAGKDSVLDTGLMFEGVNIHRKSSCYNYWNRQFLTICGNLSLL